MATKEDPLFEAKEVGDEFRFYANHKEGSNHLCTLQISEVDAEALCGAFWEAYVLGGRNAVRRCKLRELRKLDERLDEVRGEIRSARREALDDLEDLLTAELEETKRRNAI